MSETTNVAIACQGGGSHTAFTAGVLQHLLEHWDDDYELVGISGTSGGAFNALATWYGLVTADETTAAELLGSLWDGLAATEATDRLLNDWLSAVNRMQSSGLPVPQVSPYQFPNRELGKERIRDVLEAHIEFDAIPEYCGATAPELVVGTVDINDGVFRTFTNESVTVDAVLASAAVPNLFRAVEIDGHRYWDGIFSQNPPIKDLMYQPPARKPDELWIIQVNKQTLDGEPQTIDEIDDRRNELSGNISMNQELRFVQQVSEWVAQGHLPADRFSTPKIHRLEIQKRYHCSTKFDRTPSFIEELMELGRSRARTFLENER